MEEGNDFQQLFLQMIDLEGGIQMHVACLQIFLYDPLHSQKIVYYFCLKSCTTLC